MGLTLLSETQQQILKFFSEDKFFEITPTGWEDRISPVLFDLEQLLSPQKISFEMNGNTVAVTSNDPALFSLLNSLYKQTQNSKPSLSLYIFKTEEIWLLRRINEFPDETPRQEIIAPWIGICESPAAFLITNPVYVQPKI